MTSPLKDCASGFPICKKDPFVKGSFWYFQLRDEASTSNIESTADLSSGHEVSDGSPAVKPFASANAAVAYTYAVCFFAFFIRCPLSYYITFRVCIQVVGGSFNILLAT